MFTSYLQKLRLFDRDVRLFLVTIALNGFTWDGIRTVLFNLYLLRLGHGPEVIGLISAVGALAFAVFSLPAGAIGTRWGCRRTLLAGMNLVVVGNGLLPLAEFIPSAWQIGWLLTTSVLAFLGLALYFVNGPPFLMSTTGSEERNHAFSMQMALTPLAGFAGSLAAGVLPNVFVTMLGVSPESSASYRYPLFIAALLLIPGVLALLPTREVRTKQAQKRMTEVGRAPYGLIALMALVTLFRFAGRGASVTFFNVYLDTDLHTSTALIGALTAAGQLLSVPAALAAPLLTARWGNSRTLVLGSLGIAVSMLPLALIPHRGAAGFGFMSMTALFMMTTAPLRIYSQELVSPVWRPTMSAAVMMAVGLSLSAIALGGGYAIEALGYRSLFLVSAGLTAVGGVLLWGHFRAPRGKFAKRLV